MMRVLISAFLVGKKFGGRGGGAVVGLKLGLDARREKRKEEEGQQHVRVRDLRPTLRQSLESSPLSTAVLHNRVLAHQKTDT